jgi:hypothetical protein
MKRDGHDKGWPGIWGNPKLRLTWKKWRPELEVNQEKTEAIAVHYERVSRVRATYGLVDDERAQNAALT